MPTRIATKDPVTGRAITFTWKRETPPTEADYERIWAADRERALGRGQVPPQLLTPSEPNIPGVPSEVDPRSVLEKNREGADAMKRFLGGLVELSPLALMPVTAGASALPTIASGAVLDALTGAASGAITGEGASNEALDNAALGVTGSLGAGLIPVAGNMLGQAFGGMLPSKKTAMAFMREGAEQWKQGKPRIGLGNAKRTKVALKEAGGKVEDAENALTATGARGDLRNVVRDAYDTMKGELSTANFPGRARGEAVDFLKDYTKFQAAENTAPGLVGPSGPQLTPDVTPRRLGDMKRAHRARGQAIIEGKSAGELLPGQGAPNKLMEAALEKANRNEQYRLDLPKNLQPNSDNILWPDFGAQPIGPIQKANQRVADLHTMTKTDELLKDPTIFGRVGQFTTRAALGAGIGRAVGELSGQEGQTVPMTTGAVLGMLGLNPRSAGAVSNALGVGSAALPAGVRAYETIDAGRDYLQGDKKKKKKVRRRDPK